MSYDHGIGETKMKKEEPEKIVDQEDMGILPERKGDFRTTSDVPIKRIYTPEDLKDFNYSRDLGFPGEVPFTRGVYPTMHRGRLWTMRQLAGFGTAKMCNARFRYLIAQGATGLNVCFDYPTLNGCDSDDPLALGEVGKCGVAIDTLRDMELLFDGISLDEISSSLVINQATVPVLSMYIAAGEKQQVTSNTLSGTTQNDLLKDCIAFKHAYMFPPEVALRLSVDVIEYCLNHLPKWNPISISGYHIREAGANAVQELAFTLANGIAYVECAMERGLKGDDLGPRLSFFFASHNDFFEEIAKFRAARRIWTRIMQERFKATKSRSLRMRFHVQTSGYTLTSQQPVNNIVRVTLQALAAILGGTQSLHTNSFDEALALPSDEAIRIALRTQQIVAYESGVADTVDPLGGAYYLETLTNQVEERVLKYLDAIDRLGGAIAAIKKGFFHKEIADSAYKYQREVENGEKVIVGVNRYVTKEKLPTRGQTSLEVERDQIAGLRRVKEERDNEQVREVLSELREAAEGNRNLMPAALRAVKAYATVGEICGVFREVFGEYKEPPIF